MRIEYVNGTECDLKDTFRATSLELACGPQDGILEVIEDKTCHYRMRVSLKTLCQLPSFVVEEKKYTQLDLLADTGIIAALE